MWDDDPDDDIGWFFDGPDDDEPAFINKPLPMLYTPTTQKAKGVYSLSSYYPCATVIACFSAKEKYAGHLSDAYLSSGTVFARPCPPSPEHGFVESRVVKSLEELEALRVETLNANADSEILLMLKVDAKWNAIWTPSLLTVGPGHDGATSGKSTVSFPLVGNNNMPGALLKSAGITKWPYVEAVTDKLYSTYLTQLRNGPALAEVCPDFIPTKMIVEAVRKTAGEDLLKWAKVTKALPSGTVVWHPGGSLVDHYSVHCRESNVPIMLSREPIVGEELAPATLPPPDPTSMQLGVIAGSIVKDLKPYDLYTKLILLSLHNSSALRGTYSFWLGVGASLMCRLGLAALNGEARHASGSKPKSHDRNVIYDIYTKQSIHKARARLSRVTQILTYGFGDPKAHHSFGGPKWGTCGAALVPVFNAIRDLFISPSAESASALTIALNMAVNQAHNGGWWLNKFTDQSSYSQIPLGNMLLTVQTAPAIYSIWQQREKAEEILSKETKRIAAWPETSIKPVSWKSAEYDITPQSLVLTLRAATVPAARQITIPVGPKIISQMLSEPAYVEIGGGVVDLILPDSTRVPAWRDYELKPNAEKV